MKKLFVLIAASLFSCKGEIKNGNENENLKNVDSNAKIDSLKRMGFIISDSINFFEMKADSVIVKGSEFFALKDEGDVIVINEFDNGKIKNRNIKKVGNFYFEKIEQSFTGDEEELSTYFVYYRNDKIVVFDIRRNVFSKTEYLTDIFFVYKDRIKHFSQEDTDNVSIHEIPVDSNVFNEDWCKQQFLKSKHIKEDNISYKDRIPSFHCDFIFQIH